MGPQFGWFYFLPYSQNVSLVSFDSFDVLTALIAFALFNQSKSFGHSKKDNCDWQTKCVLQECRTS